jgi:hypothetical protein
MSVNMTLGPVRRAGLMAVVVLGPLSITVLRAILPYHSTDDAATMAAKVAQHQGAETTVLWLTLTAMLTLVPAVIAVGLLATRHARRLGTWGMVLAVAGFSCLAAIATPDFTALASARAGLDPGAASQLLDQLYVDPTLTVAVAMFVLGHVAGIVLLGVALLRGHAIPTWAAWALIVSQPLHVVFAVVVPSNVLDAAAWALTTAGFAMAAITLGRDSTGPAAGG